MIPACRSSFRKTVTKVSSSLTAQPRRFLNVHEYISMDLMKDYGINVPKGMVARSPEEAENIFNQFKETKGDNFDLVMKAQVLAGGRGLGTFKNGFHGGVHIVTRPSQARDYASKMIGQYLVTKQTGADGRICNEVFMVERLYLRRECYLSILLDRSANGPVIIASPKGGTSIEDVAAATPEAILKEPIDLFTGPTEEQMAKIGTFMGFQGKSLEGFKQTLKGLWNMYSKTDATLIEVNPLAETPDGTVYVCDAKINFDDNAAFRQPDIFEKRDFSQEDPREVEAAKWDLNYIGLDGSIGCMVNGAGLAMATMDIIKLYGGSPANFLDVGGGASAEQVTHAFEILNSDTNVQAILVNIFGGIMRCDVIAQGIIAAATKIGLKKPVVLRLQGTNVVEAKKLIEQSGYKIITVDDLDKAAETVVKVAEIKQRAEEVALNVSFELPL